MGSVVYRKCPLFGEGVYGCRPCCLKEHLCGRESLVPARSLLPKELWQCDPGLYPVSNSSLAQP